MLFRYNLTEKKKRVSTTYKQYQYDFYGRRLTVQGYERQALEYLVEQGFNPKDLRAESEFGDGLRIRYKYRNKVRKYFPDIYCVATKTVFEVKSRATLGLLNNKNRGWSMTCAKALECNRRGYKFCLLLMTDSGRRIKLPKNWAKMKKVDVIQLLGDTI